MSLITKVFIHSGIGMAAAVVGFYVGYYAGLNFLVNFLKIG